MAISSLNFGTILRFIEHRMHCPYPSGRLELSPAIERSVCRRIGQLHKQLKSTGSSDPTKVVKGFRSLYRLIKEPLNQSTERFEATIKKAVRNGEIPQWSADLFRLWETEQVAAFEKIGADPRRGKRSKR